MTFLESTAQIHLSPAD